MYLINYIFKNISIYYVSMNKSINNTNNIEFVSYINDILSESKQFSHLQNDIFKDLIVPPGYYIKNKQPNQEVINYEFSNDKCSDNKCIDNKTVDGFINLVSINNKSKNKTTRKNNNKNIDIKNNNKNIDIKKKTKKRSTKKHKK